MSTESAPSPITPSSRSRSSLAALVVKVTARMLVRRDRPSPDEVGDPGGEERGLARAGAREDQDRTVGSEDDLALLGAEAREVQHRARAPHP